MDFWAVEARRDHLIDEALAECNNFGIVLTHVRAEWTQPQLLAVAWTVRPEVLASLDRAIASRREGLSQPERLV